MIHIIFVIIKTDSISSDEINKRKPSRLIRLRFTGVIQVQVGTVFIQSSNKILRFCGAAEPDEVQLPGPQSVTSHPHLKPFQ